MKKICLLFLLISFPVMTKASVVISEIMYDLSSGSDEGREWIEVYNGSDVPIDFSTYKFFEADTNHKLTPVSADGIVPALSYAIIVSNPEKFKTDWPGFSGQIFDSTFSLNNTGEILALKDKEGNIISQYFYNTAQGASGDGDSLQLVNNSWIASSPTPGKANTYSARSLPQAQPVSEIKTKIEPKVENEPDRENQLVKNQYLKDNFKLVTNEKEQNFVVPFLIFGIFLAFCASFVYFLRQKKPKFSPGDDFEITE